MYAVVDVETTGLNPSWNDRVVEIAIVQIDDSGATEAEWCTLVNPERDLGPRHIHGVTAAEARTAPRFDQLAGAILDLLRGRILVAHNWAFDARFLAAEYARIGVKTPISDNAGLCTMRLAGQFLPGVGRGLADCCQSAGITLTKAHAALHDARAAAQLLAYFLLVAGRPPPWANRLTADLLGDWPRLSSAEVALVRRRAEGHVEAHFLSRLVDRLPRTHRPDADAYLDVLDRALLDRHISATEADALVAVAQDLGLSRDEVIALHEHYLQALATVAASDGTITPDEHKDLDAVADLLGLGSRHVNHALRTARHALALLGGAPTNTECRFLQPGDIVVFTGEMDRPREVWEARATNAGLCVGQSVTKQTRLLVAADPDSMSGKAQKAAKYGIPVVHPAAFLPMLSTTAG